MAEADTPTPESETDGATVDDSERLVDVFERAMQRFDSVAIPQREIRDQSLAARRFLTIPGAMWEGPWQAQFENVPKIEDDQISPFVDRILNDYRDNREVVDFIPASEDADEETANLLDGLYRADNHHFSSQQARDNALYEAVLGGFGAYRLFTDYADPYDPDRDEQRVNPAAIIVDADQSVYFDGGARLYDKSDAQWAFIVTADPRQVAIDKWGADNIDDWPLTTWRWNWDWYTPDVVLTAEYYEVEEASDRLVIMSNSATGKEQRMFQSDVEPSRISDMQAEGWKKRTRTVKRRRVRKYVMNGSRVLKGCGRIAGDQIPIVPVYGRRSWVSNMERWEGFVWKRMEGQRIYNSQLSRLVETSGMAPFEVQVVAPEQMTPDIAEQWASGNINRDAFRYLLPLRDEEGKIVAVGPIAKISTPEIPQVTVQLLQFAAASLAQDKDSSEQVKSNVSPDAMDIAAGRVDAKSSMWLDNMRQSVEREAVIYKGMVVDVTFEQGRVVETMTPDGQDGTAVIGQPMLDKNGIAKARNDLSVGKYKVTATIQEANTTKRQRTVRQSLALAQASAQIDPDFTKICLLRAVQNMDGEGQEDIARYAHKQLVTLGVEEPTKEEAAAAQEAQQAQQKPDPQQIALEASIAESQSKVKVNEAKAQETLASAGLKEAQALSVGGPDSVPDTPTGLHNPEVAVGVAEKAASANLKNAQADHLRDGMGHRRIMTEHQIEMDRRQQNLAETQPTGNA